jgi:hypothetical protein
VPLFAQAAPDLDGAALGLTCCAPLVSLAAFVAFLLTLSRTLSRCSPRNRTMQPGEVWLNLAPVLGLYWCFRTVACVSESLRREFRARGRPAGGDFGYAAGMVFCAANSAGLVVGVAGSVMAEAEPAFVLMALPFGIVASVAFIKYWIKVAWYSGQIAARWYEYDDEDDPEDPPPSRGGDGDDGSDDRHPPPREHR